MSRIRYWKLTADEMEKFSYNEDKMLNWEIKGMKKLKSDEKTGEKGRES